MTDENNKLAKNISDLFKPKKYGIAAQRAAAVEKLKSVDPENCPSRIAIVMDDSGSMGGQPIHDAHDGIEIFTRSCNPADTSISIFPLNTGEKPLTIDYDLLNMYVKSINATNGTPLYETTDRALATNITRAVLFSDGAPSGGEPDYQSELKFSKWHEDVVAKAIELKIPLDTVFIGSEFDRRPIEIMKDLADRTGGIFVHFKDTASLSRNLKYLAPALRALLMNEEIKAKIERGESI